MSQYNPQAQPQQQGQGGGGGRGGGRGGYQGRGPQGGRNPQAGGRGPQGGRGGMQQGGRGGMQQQGGRGGMQQQGGGRGGPVSAWQPTPTSSLQQASYGRQPQQQGGGYHPQHQQHPGHPNQHHQQGGPAGPHYAANMHYNPYAAQQANAYRGGQGPGGWQATGYPPQGGVYYPPAQPQQQGGLGAVPGNATPAAGAAGSAAPTPVVAKPREKKPLVITDKNGNVLDFRSEKAKTVSSLTAAVAKETEKPANDAAAVPAAAKSADAGSKLREAALAAISGKDAKGSTEAAKKPTEKEQTKAAPAPALAPAPAPANKAAEPTKVKAPAPAKEEKKEPEPKAPAKTLAAVAAAPAPAPAKPLSAAAAVKSGSSLAAAAKKPSLAAIAAAPAPSAPKSVGGTLRPGGKSRVTNVDSKGVRRVYTKEVLMKLKKTESCMRRPADLPDMTIERGPVKQQGGGGGGNRGNNRGGGGGGGSNWDRGQNNSGRRGSQNNNKDNNDWQRGQAPPKNKGNKGGRRQSQNEPLLEGPVAPLVKSENRWKPSKDKNPLAVAEKTVKGILNKMTKEKFDRLATQMCDIQILSYDMLTMMIHNVYEKAIDEPAFGDMYADLCVRLSKGAAQANNDFVKVIESDEEPPTEGDAAPASHQSASSSHVVYRWSNDVSTTDSEVIGPLESAEDCIDAALSDSGSPEPRGEMKLELVKLVIKKGVFIKILKKKDSENDFYCVYFPVSEAEECGQQLSEIFLSEVECVSSAKKKNSFKRSLLNKCEDEFKKQDIYVDWKKEKKEYEESKASLSDADCREKESDLEFRRIKIKKQMLGNIKFIGQLYKKGLLKEKIMRYCISSLLKLEELEDANSKNPEYKDSGDMDMDEEDHEAICSMFTTIGSTIDKSSGADFMKVCFTKIHQLSLDKKNLPARSRFMYKDLLELRENRWVPRRDEGKAKTLEEIRKDVEKEEQRQAKISQQNYQNDRSSNNNRRGGQQGGYDNSRRGSNFGGRGSGGGGNNRNRRESAKPQEVTDDDGFTTIVTRGAPVNKGNFTVGGSADKKQPAPKAGGASSSNAPAPLSKEKLERRIKSMRAEYMQDPNTSELLLSMDELSGTPDAGATLVSKSADALLDCKEAERKAISDVIRILYENKKLTNADIKTGLAEFIEFIDSMVIDCPKLFEYVGDILAVVFQSKAVDVAWYVDAVEKTKLDPDTVAPEKLTRATIGSVRKSFGAGAAQEIFGGSGSQMNGLVGADKWSAISNDLLA